MGSEIVHWGRNKSPGLVTLLATATILFLSPLFVILVWNTCHKTKGSIIILFSQFDGMGNLIQLIPRPTLFSFLIFICWLAFQAILYIVLPAPIVKGQETPAGYVLNYKVNGLLAWTLSNSSFVLFTTILHWFPASIVADNWEGLLVAANFYGFLLTGISYVKALLAPTHPGDCKFTGSYLYDLFMGIELNPRLGEMFDFKLFHNGRPGIVAWTIINFSFAGAQYNRFGSVSDSMILVNILQALYVVDFFLHEDWYLKTIDIAHDHFGFYLAWGDSVWLPFMYTLQAQYLAYHPIKLGGYFWLILTLGLIGYSIFREANFQKDLCRRTQGKCIIWGSPARVIRTTYKSTDGKSHHSVLLVSGFWAMAKHCNYLGDLILSLAMCLACGFEHALPHFYIVYMLVLLTTRVERDHSRCSGKYGHYWDQYSHLVPYKMIPGIY